MNKNALAALGVSFLAAIFIMITVVLPAEFSVDPLGTGELLGVTGMSDTGGQQAYRSIPVAYRRHEDTIELAPFESVELKYRLPAGSMLMFHWAATGEVVWDLHAEPDGAAEGFAESFAAGRAPGDNGYYLARFDGIHGWFFENRLSRTVTLSIEVQGFFEEGIKYAGGYPDPFNVPANP